ncbi:hypothetical protein [Thermomonospora amylolytica]|uniref:hypothetical protein n=1 Tax=Thermomonospora amylolytica TaxID=1411117 RepID=UPI001F1E284A|nr:hypothetical protein [Thermomonospora amylolytica]
MLDLRRDRQGVLSYTVAVRSLDGSGAQRRGVRLLPARAVRAPEPGWVKCTMRLRNTGAPGQAPYTNADVYRLSANAPAGWTTWLPHTVVTAPAGGVATVEVYARRDTGRHGVVELTAVSESDPRRSSTAVCSTK